MKSTHTCNANVGFLAAAAKGGQQNWLRLLRCLERPLLQVLLCRAHLLARLLHHQNQFVHNSSGSHPPQTPPSPPPRCCPPRVVAAGMQSRARKQQHEQQALHSMHSMRAERCAHPPRIAA